MHLVQERLFGSAMAGQLEKVCSFGAPKLFAEEKKKQE
jgi:hypothetical protein